MAQRNIVVKSFCDIPMADLEMIFPEKKVYIKPFILIQLVVTIALAFFTIVSTLFQVHIASALTMFCMLQATSLQLLHYSSLRCFGSHMLCLGELVSHHILLCGAEQGELVGVGQPCQRDCSSSLSGLVPLTADTAADARCHDSGAV